jgi:hypothetical protein
VILGVVALLQRNEAIDQKNAALGSLMATQAQLASNQGGGLLERSLLFAVEAEQRLPSPVEATTILLKGLPLLRPSVASLVYPGGTAGISELTFSPDSKYLATVSFHGTGITSVWDVASGSEIARVKADKNWMLDAAFSPDGKYLATASRDNTARLWLWQKQDLFNEACRLLTRILSVEEWKQIIGDEPYHKTCENLPEPT